MSDAFLTRCARLVGDLGIANARDVRSVRRLNGGVASDIGVVDLPDRQICVKFALAKLRVAQDWHAPVHRNRAEYHWLEFAGALVPQSAPRLLGLSEAENGFAMEFLHGDDIYLWKTALLQSKTPKGEAARVAGVLGQIHAASASPGFERAPFDNADDFRELRIEPYLTFTATRHPEIAPALMALAARLYRSRVALVHGDVSPKNILFRREHPIILDAECATIGDPAFDVSFCLNHLILKAVHLPLAQAPLFEQVLAFWDSYRRWVSWENPQKYEARVAALLPALMLARVDGKSPVEYLSATRQALVRAVAVPLIASPRTSVADLLSEIRRSAEGL